MNFMNSIFKKLFLHLGTSASARTCFVVQYEPVSPKLRELQKLQKEA